MKQWAKKAQKMRLKINVLQLESMLDPNPDPNPDQDPKLTSKPGLGNVILELKHCIFETRGGVGQVSDQNIDPGRYLAGRQKGDEVGQ